jgi:hypothetical protein
LHALSCSPAVGRMAGVPALSRAEQPPAADCQKRPLVPRSRFRQRLRRSVDMTSDVKSWEQLLYVCLMCFPVFLGRAGARKTRRLIMLISVGWVPPSLYPSGACLMLGTRIPFGLVTPPRVTPHRGCGSSDGRENLGALWRQPAAIFMLWVSEQLAWQWPTERHAMLGQWPRHRGWHVCL